MTFIVYALPRSRTAWLAAFLTYRDWACHHEVAIQMRSVADAVSFLRQPNTGTAETAAAQGFKIIQHHIPDIRSVVIRRPVADVVDAVLNVDVSGVATYDRGLLQRNMEHGARCLDRITGALVVDYADLHREDACAAIWEHCLPYSFDRARWEEMRAQNIQADTRAVLQYYFNNRDAVERFKAACKSEMRRLARAGLITNRSDA